MCCFTTDWAQTRNFYGLSVEEKFHQPCAAWHRSGLYIFAAAAAGTVTVFHVGTTKVCDSAFCVLYIKLDDAACDFRLCCLTYGALSWA